MRMQAGRADRLGRHGGLAATAAEGWLSTPRGTLRPGSNPGLPIGSVLKKREDA